MSKLTSLGALFSGLGGLAVGAVAVWKIVSPSPIINLQDLTATLSEVQKAIPQETFVASESELIELEAALEKLTGKVAQSAIGQNGALLSVARSFAGLQEYKHGEIFDFVAPNGESKLFVVNVTDETFYFTADGSLTRSLRLGQNIPFKFGEQTCVFENVGLKPGKSVIVRSSCS